MFHTGTNDKRSADCYKKRKRQGQLGIKGISAAGTTFSLPAWSPSEKISRHRKNATGWRSPQEYVDAYQGYGPVPYVDWITTCAKPAQEVVSF